MADWEALFGEGSTARQLLIWQFLAQIVGALTSPMTDYLTQLVNADHPLVPLSPPDLADMVVRNILGQDEAAAIAARSGISATDFGLLVVNTGQAPDLTTLMEGYRRKVLPLSGTGPEAVSVEQGLREGHLRDKWIPLIEKLGVVPIGVADAVDATVENQITFAQGQQFAYENGLDAEGFQILVNTRGNPPSPTELFDLYHRGVIPMGGTGPNVTSVTQGLSESALKDKWITAFEQLATALPPPRTVTALQRNGTITASQALDYYLKSGLDQATAQQYVQDATNVKTATDKNLAKSDILTLYADRAIPAQMAVDMLGVIGYEPQEAGDLLQIQDLHLATVQTDAAINKIRSYYVAHKLTANAAIAALGSLGVPGSQRSELLQIWAVERGATVKTLTESQIVDAVYYGIMDPVTAGTELEALGYTPYDAWVLLSLKFKAPLGTAPPRDAVALDVGA